MKLWGKLIQKQKIIQSIVIENNNPALSKEQQRKDCLEQLCYDFDIPYPIWLPYNEQDYKKYKKTAFKQDHFIEPISFDYLEIQELETEKVL
ncbi:MAG: hypothetical protein GX238_01230 [Epulopiscium sp.]|nr:hypothetical protein [Candidatus Epulonipiscium sp.]